MKRKAHPAQASTSQLELPLGPQEAVHDLSYYIGLGKVFATYHKRWPHMASSRDEFRAARIHDYDGQRIDRELRFPAPALEADPAYQALRARCLADGMTEGVTLAALDTRYRTVLSEHGMADLFASIVLPRQDSPGAVRYATGVPAHRPGELSLHIGDAIRAQALRLAGMEPDDVRVFAAGFPVRVQAAGELTDFIGRAGLCGPAVVDHLADDYLLEAGDGGSLFLRCRVHAGRRYAGSFDSALLARWLAAVYGADPVLAALSASAAPALPPAPALPAVATAAPDSDEELREQLAALEPEGRSLHLPIQALSRLADIRRMLEQAGGVFDTQRQRFDFEEDIDPALVVERLLSGGVP